MNMILVWMVSWCHGNVIAESIRRKDLGEGYEPICTTAFRWKYLKILQSLEGEMFLLTLSCNLKKVELSSEVQETRKILCDEYPLFAA